jgi:hypothetical protein
MKIKVSFVTNSSSTSYVFKNISKRTKTLVDFVKENPHLILAYKTVYLNSKYDSPEVMESHNQEEMIKSAEENNIIFIPKTETECAFGDEDGTLIGRVFDYILRNGGKSKNFTWKMKSCRGVEVNR